MSLSIHDHPSIQTMFDFQRNLSRLQAIPVMGFVVVSPVKAVFGIAQMVLGVALVIIGCVGHLLTLGQTDCIPKLIDISAQHVLIGGFATGYAIANITTFGLLSILIEGVCEPKNRNSRCY